MNRMAFGILAGGAAAGAFLSCATAHADPTDPPVDTASWTPVYGTDSANILQDTDAYSQTWSLPASFTNVDGTVLEGQNYVTQNWWGGTDDQFIDTASGDVYDQNQLFPGFTSLYYDADGDGTDAVAYLKTPFGNIDVSSMASSYAPTDFSDVDPWTADVAATDAALFSALSLGLPEGAPTDGTWSPTYDFANAELMQDSELSSPTWVVDDSTFTYGDAADPDAVTLDGTSYFTQSLGGYDTQFLADDGALYAQDQLGLGFTNLYYDADPDTAGGIVDMLKTPFGTFDISWASSFFTPTDFTDAVPAGDSLVGTGGLLTDAALYSALDLGLPDVAPDAAASLFDPLAWLGL